MNLANYTMRCGTSSQCRHNLCDGDCGRPLRDRDHTQADHPWTVVEYAFAGMCWKCYNNMLDLKPEDLQDQRHILMSDEKMAHIRETSPEMYVWHLYRRHRLGLTTAA